ncbi:MAG: acylneuraminate cytidylyltransferase family protein [Candidatus Omnitrophica bacterium]|nr:acylneuraminate cytidylyltransferase family protein [Candidatus Omnitrophota bacterium]
MEILGFIPARAGSKGIPKKNLALVNCKPLISYTIAAAQASCVTRILVSTDSEEIAQVSRALGADVPFLRPAALAGDTALISDAILDALARLREKENYAPEVIVLLQPTSPLRQARYIDAAVELFLKNDVDSVISISDPIEHPALMVYWPQPTAMTFLMEGKYATMPRQAYPACSKINGMLYVFSPKTLAVYNNIFGKKVLPYQTPQADSIDIDSPGEMEIAAALIQYRQRQIT